MAWRARVDYCRRDLAYAVRVEDGPRSIFLFNYRGRHEACYAAEFAASLLRPGSPRHQRAPAADRARTVEELVRSRLKAEGLLPETFENAPDAPGFDQAASPED